MWSINDKLPGRVEADLSAAGPTFDPGESYTSKLTALLPPVKPGAYRLIVRTDIFNDVYEGPDEANNRTASPDVLNVTVDELHLGVPFDTTLNTGQERLFQVEVPLGQTLVVELTTSAEEALNEAFIRFNNAPDGIQYDAVYEGALAADQRAIIPIHASRHLLHSCPRAA